MNRDDIIKAIMYHYGVTRTQAKEYLKDYSEERCRYLLEGWMQDCKKSFYND